MKKGIVLLLLVVCMIALTGCGKKTTTKEKEEDKKIVIKDEGFGTTTMTYSNNKDYKVEEEHSGKYTTVKVTSEKENFIIEMYHFDISSASYGIGKTNRSDSEGFLEYTWNNYLGYIYNANKSGVNFNIMLKDNSKGSKALFGTVSSVNSADENVIETFKSDSVQKLLNTIVFEEK